METSAAVWGAAWAGLVVVGAARARPRVGRHHGLRPADRGPHRAGPVLLESLGRLVLVGALRRPSASREHSRRAGCLAAGVLIGLATWPPLGLVAGVACWQAPAHRTRRAERRRLAGIEAQMAEVVDLFGVAVSAGMTVPLAVAAVARRAGGPLGSELQAALDRAGLGQRTSDALEGMIASAGEPVRPLVAALTDCDRYGAPLQATLDRLAGEVRLSARVKAEEAARRVPVKLLFPLVLLILPAFALLTVAPLIASAARSLHL